MDATFYRCVDSTQSILCGFLRAHGHRTENWIATGDDDGDIFLWNADVVVPTSVSFAMTLPRSNQSERTTNSGRTTGTVLVFFAGQH